MSRLIFTLMLISVWCLPSQADQHIIYVDVSAKQSSIDNTRKKIISTIDNVSNEALVAFISNGSKPFVCEQKSEIKEAFTDLKYMTSPNAPHEYTEIQKLNQLIIDNNMLQGINQPNRELNEDVNFHFFLHPEQIDNYSQLKRLVKQALLTNRLYNKEGRLIENCKVNVYLDCSKINRKACKTKLDKYEIKYKDFSISNYQD